MLGKLLRYDIKNIGRQTGYEYIILAVLMLLHLAAKGVYDLSASSFSRGFCAGTRVVFYAGMAMACAVLLTTIIQYYFKNLFKDEGYLMNTLPVSAGGLVTSKIVAAIFWLGMMFAACYLCEAAVSKNLFWGIRFFSSFCEGRQGGWFFVVALLLYGVVFFVNLLSGVLMGGATGYGFTGKYQGVCVFFLCLLAYMLNQLIAVVVLGIVFDNYLADVEDSVSLAVVAKAFLLWSAVHLILAGVYGWIAVKRMNTHLNLD